MNYGNFAIFFRSSIHLQLQSVPVSPQINRFRSEVAKLNDEDPSLSQKLVDLINSSNADTDPTFSQALTRTMAFFARCNLDELEDPILPPRIMQAISISSLREHPLFLKGIQIFVRLFPRVDTSFKLTMNDQSVSLSRKIFLSQISAEMCDGRLENVNDCSFKVPFTVHAAAMKIFEECLMGDTLPKELPNLIDTVYKIADYFGVKSIERQWIDDKVNPRKRSRSIDETINNHNLVEAEADPELKPKKHKKLEALRTALRHHQAKTDALSPDDQRAVEIMSKLTSTTNNIQFVDIRPPIGDKLLSTALIKKSLNIGRGKMGPAKIADWQFLLSHGNVEHFCFRPGAKCDVETLCQILSDAPSVLSIDLRFCQITENEKQRLRGLRGDKVFFGK